MEPMGSTAHAALGRPKKRETVSGRALLGLAPPPCSPAAPFSNTLAVLDLEDRRRFDDGALGSAEGARRHSAVPMSSSMASMRSVTPSSKARTETSS
jgi:hypothetical protein